MSPSVVTCWRRWHHRPLHIHTRRRSLRPGRWQTGEKQINSHHLTEEEPNAPRWNFFFFWMQIKTKVCSVMNRSFHQFFMENNLSLNAQCLYPWTFMKGPIYDFTWIPVPHLPLVRDKDGRLINIYAYRNTEACCHQTGHNFKATKLMI